MTAGPGDDSVASERRLLESWKEIASYLGRSVRTVQLWEKEERLPVHRLQGGVLAYADELDQWIQQRRVSPAPAAASAPEESHLSRRTAVLIAAVVVVIAIAIAAWRALSRFEPEPLQRLDGNPSLLIAAVENRTAEPIFDGSLEYLLERGLTEPGRIEVVSAERVADVLLLMRKGPQRVDRALAREIAHRDGQVDAILSGRIERIGKRYVVGVDLISVESGTRLAAFTRNADDHDGVRTAVGELATEIRQALGRVHGEAGLEDDSPEKVTTRSLRAAQLFTQADRLIPFTNNETAERLLREAIAEDPEFASAHMHLAFAIYNQGRKRAEYLPFAERAVTLSTKASPRERYFILGSYASMQGNPEEAVAHYLNVLKIDPNHYWANSNVANIIARSRRSREAIPYRLKAAELRPNHFIVNQLAAESLELWGDQPEESERYYERARKLLSRADWEQYPVEATRARLRDAEKAWQSGDLARLLPELHAAAAQALRNTGPGADALMAGVAEFEIAMERFDRAAELAGRIEDPLLRSALTARAAYWKGDLSAARAAFRQYLTVRTTHPTGSAPPTAVPVRPPLLSGADLFLMARCGMTADAEKLIPLAHGTERNQVLAAVAYHRAEDEALERLLASSSGSFASFGRPLAQLALLSYDLLGEILERRGEHDRAIALIETTSTAPERASFAKPEWIHLQRRLARLYRTTGRAAEAERIEARLQQLTIASQSTPVTPPAATDSR